jgi:nitrite reductase (NADH) large subunit
MVGHRLLEHLVELGATTEWELVVFAEEARPAYDRVALSSFFDGKSADDLGLVPDGFFDQPGLTLHLGDPVTDVDRHAQTVTSARGTTVRYDALVLATGSYPFVPPVTGHDAPGCFVYRTLDDLVAIRDHCAGARVGVVVGGGLLGLEAANALRNLGVEAHVLEVAPHLMPAQLDEECAAMLRQRIEDLGVVVHTGTQLTEVVRDGDGRAVGVRCADGSVLSCEVVVFSAGIRPRDDLGRHCGLDVGDRGGIVVDEACRTSDPRVYAIGECALVDGRVYGLVAPGYQMARVVADQVMGGDASFAGADMSTKLKVLGVDVASFGDAMARTPGARRVRLHDPVAKVAKFLVVGDSGELLGGMLVGEASRYQTMLQIARGDLPAPDDVATLLLAESSAGTRAATPAALADEALVCSCNDVTKGAICRAIVDDGLTEIGAVKQRTRAGSSCGGCVPIVKELLAHEMQRAGIASRKGLCEHFAYTRQELFDIVRVSGIRAFSELLERYGSGGGCEICKPVVASVLASTRNDYILDGEQASLQDTNDHFLANLQKNGTYSVVPRVPGGELTPAQLITLGAVARDFGLYTKITGGQRVDLFGARVDDLPRIWERLIAAGFESGHAYGKALRTVKSCVGETWCRYGVQDSTTLAIQLELRYRGLRAPHKLKSAVSGCARECAEAQGKDFGVVATERGWNLYVCGNGGMRPQHAVLLGESLDTDTLIRTVDRFLMFYIRTANHLERTATWFNNLDGGVEYLKRVVFDDALGICEELDAAMARHVATYACEWKATLEDPARLRRFRSFVNSDAPDPEVVFVTERSQPRPARPEELEAVALADVGAGRWSS